MTTRVCRRGKLSVGSDMMASMRALDRQGGWSDVCLSIVGKTDRNTRATGSLHQHLADTAAVADVLWQDVIAESVRHVVEVDLGGSGIARDIMVFLAGIHDIGKASNNFAVKLPPWATSRSQQLGLPRRDLPKPVPHGTIGRIVVMQWLEERFGAGPGCRDLAEIVGGHHGVFPDPADIGAAEDQMLISESPAWEQARAEILSAEAAELAVSASLVAVVRSGVPLRSKLLLEAVVILADWIASNAEFFPYQDDRPASLRAKAAVHELGLLPPWHARPQPREASSLFRQRFPDLAAEPRAMQTGVFDAAVRADRSPLIIIEAPTGSGKTEAGLMAAEVLAARFACGGLFVGLPTMATANPVFGKVAAWLRTMDEPTSLNLAHSKAALNEDFARLIHASSMRRVGEGQGEDPEDQLEDLVRAVEWLWGRMRWLLANHVVGTIDQALMAGLKVKHVVLRLLGLAGKVVLIDEVHAADVYMRQYLLIVLEWLGRFNAPVILMSATLPPAQRQQFVDAYRRGRQLDLFPLEPSSGYPRITLVDSGVRCVELPADVSRDVHIAWLPDEDEALRELLSVELAEGGCVTIIRNTVRRAQETYEVLRDAFGDDVQLLHSRFIAPHRLQRERRLVDSLGPGGARPDRLIVVGTQVLEQSLDIDFDLMVTDLAPVDLVLQRAGRLHRHSGTKRPPKLRTPQLFISGVDLANPIPSPDRGSRAVYGLASLLRSAAVLAAHLESGHLSIPGDVPDLVAAAYNDGLQPPGGWEEEWEKAEEDARLREQSSRDRARPFVLRPPENHASLDGWLGLLAVDPESPRAQGRAQVRDGEDTIEVIVLQRDRDGVLRLPGGAGQFAGASIPEALPLDDDQLTRAMARCTISLPVQLSTDACIADLEPPLSCGTWKTSPWLRGQLALVLDEDGFAAVDRYICHYTPELGLVVTDQRSMSA